MTKHKLHCSVQDVEFLWDFFTRHTKNEVLSSVYEAPNLANELFDILYSLAECQPHQFSSLKLRAKELLQILEGGEN